MPLTIDPKHTIGTGQLLWLVSGREPADDDDTAQPVLADTEDEAKATFEQWLHEISRDVDAQGAQFSDGTTCYIVTCEQIGRVEPDLSKRLRDLAAGARSKASLLASKSPTSVYTNPVDVLRAIAKEAEDGLAPDPDKGLEIQRTLVLSTAHMDPGFGLFLDRQVDLRAGNEEGEQSLIVDHIGEFGWRICLSDMVCDLYMAQGDAELRDILEGVEIPESTEPCALPDLIRFGLQHGCHWLALDRDGPIVAGLPVYDWELKP